MRTLLLSISLLLTLQASDCATAGSVQDSAVTQAKREVDAESTRPTPTPVAMRDVYPTISSDSPDGLSLADLRAHLGCYLPENPTASQMDTYLRHCVAKDRKKKLPKRPGVEGGQR